MRRRADSLIFVVNQILDAVVEVGNLAGRLLLCLKAKVIIDGRFGAQIRVALDVGVARMRPVHVELAGRRGAVGTAKVGLKRAFLLKLYVVPILAVTLLPKTSL